MKIKDSFGSEVYHYNKKNDVIESEILFVDINNKLIDIFQSEFGKLPLPNIEFWTFNCDRESFIESSIALQLALPISSTCFHTAGKSDHIAKIIKYSADNLFAQIQYENMSQAVVWSHPSILKSMELLGRRTRK